MGKGSKGTVLGSTINPAWLEEQLKRAKARPSKKVSADDVGDVPKGSKGTVLGSTINPAWVDEQVKLAKTRPSRKVINEGNIAGSMIPALVNRTSPVKHTPGFGPLSGQPLPRPIPRTGPPPTPRYPHISREELKYQQDLEEERKRTLAKVAKHYAALRHTPRAQPVAPPAAPEPQDFLGGVLHFLGE